MMTKRLLQTAATATLLYAFAPFAGADDGFPLGVSAGDVNDSSAICWTRTAETATVRLEVSLAEDFGVVLAAAEHVVDADTDFTLRVEVSDLAPDTLHYYRFIIVETNEISPVGRFRTAPLPDEPRPFRFLHSGDSNAAAQPFHLLSFAADEEPDLWFWAGDIVYGDVPFGGPGVATDLAAYRAKYVQNLADEHLKRLRAAAPLWAQWDDHEVANDYDGGDLEPHISEQRRADAYRAFFEYLPIRDQDIPADPFRLYRSFRYGRLAEFFILDNRQYRSRDVGREGGGLDPYAYLLPTFEPLTILRLRDPARTMLGDDQLAWLKDGLLNSTATWKFILSSVTFTSLLVLPYDRWDGYDAERYDLLRFIDTNNITGVVILSADIHANAHNPDVTHLLRKEGGRWFTPGFRVPEFVSGPIATATFRQEVVEIGAGALNTTPDELNDSLLFNLAIDLAAARLKWHNGLRYFEPDRYAYLVVDVDSDGLAVTYRGLRPDPTDPDPILETLYAAHVDPPPAAPLPCFVFPFSLAVGLLAVGLAVRRRFTSCPSVR